MQFDPPHRILGMRHRRTQGRTPAPAPRSVARRPLPLSTWQRKAQVRSTRAAAGHSFNPRVRLLLVWGVLMLGGLGLTANLVRLQITQAPVLQERAQRQQMFYLRPFVPRRPIVERNGNVVALDQPVYTLYAHPKVFKQPLETIAAQLAPLLNRPLDKVVQQLRQAESGIQLDYGLAEEVAEQIDDLYIDGIELIQQQQRFYPHQSLFADVVGYVNSDHQGQAGVEFSQQKVLERTVQAVRLNRTGSGRLIPDRLPGGFLHVDDLRLQLTLDSRIQRTARAALQQQVKQYQAKRGAVLVMDARDGAILSLVSEPTYDPNEYYKANIELFRNWVLADLYEPGSTFKPLNVAIALEAGVIKPDTVINDEGQIFVGGWPIQNFDYSHAGAKGPLSITKILQDSSNVGMVHIVQRMKPEIFYGWLEKMGLGQATGIDLPFEAPSQIKDQETFTQYVIEPATTSFGQGLSLTPIQLVQLHAALANGGKLVTPHVVRGLFDTNGQAYWQPALPAPRQIFSASTAQTVLTMMEKVVSDGTGKPAQIPGYRVGGKTGTAQKASAQGGYAANAKITSFVGVFPIEAPRYVVLAVMDEPKGENAYGSTVTAPIVKAVMEALITTEGIAPAPPQ